MLKKIILITAVSASCLALFSRKALLEMAKATRGSTESSSNPNFLFKQAVDASENYYLIYYASLNYKRDGKFRKIKVKVKNKKCRISHRAGYFAN